MKGMRGKGYIVCFVMAAAVLLAGIAGFGVSVHVTGQTAVLSKDLTAYRISKMYADSDEVHIVGTQEGEVFAFDADGNDLWNVGTPYARAVYDIAADGDNVYVAYANGHVLGFSKAAAIVGGFSGDVFLTQCKDFYMGASLSGSVKNTQLLLSSASEGAFYLRGVFNEASRVNRIYKADIAAQTVVQTAATSAPLGGMAIDGEDNLYYANRSTVYVVNAAGAAAEEVVNTNEELCALSFSGGFITAISTNNNLFTIDPSAGGVEQASIGVNLDSEFVFSTGAHFVAKIKNGGVALINSQSKAVGLTMNAADTSNIVMWADESFVLRDESDIEQPFVLFYTAELARTIALFSTLKIVFLVVAVLALIASVYTGLCLKKDMRERTVRKIKAFFAAVWTHKHIYGLLAIPFVLLIVFYYIPIVLGFGLAFFDYIPGERMVFTGFDNFVLVMRTPEFWSSALTMVLFLIADIIKAIVPPIIFAEAILAVRLKKFSFVVRILLFLPGILPGVATVLVWSAGIFGATSNGLVNGFIGWFVPGFAKNWVFSASNATAIGTMIAFGLPWVGSYLIFFGAVSGISTSLFESAELEGCGWRKRILKIDLPLILPQIKYIFITSFIASVQNYTSIFILHGVEGQVKTPALMMYREITNAKYGTASVMGILIFAFLSIVTVLNFRMQSDKS